METAVVPAISGCVRFVVAASLTKSLVLLIWVILGHLFAATTTKATVVRDATTVPTRIMMTVVVDVVDVVDVDDVDDVDDGDDDDGGNICASGRYNPQCSCCWSSRRRHPDINRCWCLLCCRKCRQSWDQESDQIGFHTSLLVLAVADSAGCNVEASKFASERPYQSHRGVPSVRRAVAVRGVAVKKGGLFHANSDWRQL